MVAGGGLKQGVQMRAAGVPRKTAHTNTALPFATPRTIVALILLLPTALLWQHPAQHA